jgi:Reverse transcriptase (RNA-dependent DNA polymerase)
MEPICTALQELFSGVWASEKVPAEWKEGIIITLYKGKGPRNECGSYRLITLLFIPGKVFSHVLLECLQLLLTKHRRPEQLGFTAGRSTLDAILTLRLLSELHHECNRHLSVAYVDIKAAFDSVDRTALSKALRG